MKYPDSLTYDEWVVLNRLARKSKMDCWFVLRSNGTRDWCYDAENSVAISLRRAIREMDEGLTEEDLAALSDRQRIVYGTCLKRFDLAG